MKNHYDLKAIHSNLNNYWYLTETGIFDQKCNGLIKNVLYNNIIYTLILKQYFFITLDKKYYKIK